MLTHPLIKAITLAAVATFLGGCARDNAPERIPVSGTVTYNGKPIPEGTIRFIPDQTSLVPSAGAPIRDGVYKIDGHGGVPIGTHKIRIEAYREPAGSVTRAPLGLTVTQQYLPKKYNDASQLTLTIESASSPIVKDYDLKD